jgi:hypothetical protein
MRWGALGYMMGSLMLLRALLPETTPRFHDE